MSRYSSINLSFGAFFRISILNEIGLQILNCVWDGLNEATWYTEEKKFTLDYVCMQCRTGMKGPGRELFDGGPF